MNNENELKAALRGIQAALDDLEIERDKGLLDIGRYLQLKTEYETRKAKLEENLARRQQEIAVTPPERLLESYKPYLLRRGVAVVVVILALIVILLKIDVPALRPTLTSTPTSTATPTPTPTSTATPTPAITPTATQTPLPKGPCPNRQNIDTGEPTISIEVPKGHVAYLIGWKFDGEEGGFFVTINGPYNGLHTVRNGVYCPPIPTENTEQVRTTIELLEQECRDSTGKCRHEKTLP